MFKVKKKGHHVLKNDMQSKSLNLLKAAGGGMAVGFIDKMGSQMSQYQNMNDHLKNAIPAALAFFVADFDAPIAMGMAGAAGYKEGKTLGIFSIEDSIEDIFDEEISDIEINDSDDIYDTDDDIDDIEINDSEDDIYDTDDDY